MTTRLILPLLALTCAAHLTACSSQRRGPYAPLIEQDRIPLEAQRLSAEAGELMAGDPERAESLLRDALTFDLYHGPAHNNLGVLYLSQNLLYQAAGEFEWARKMMPAHPDPRLNLGIAMERAGRIDEALAAYRAALEVYPGHIASLQALFRTQFRNDRADDGTADALREIAMRGETEPWRSWARAQLAKQGG